MKKLKPAYGEEGWSIEVTCVGESHQPGCGAVLEVTRDDLYLRDTSVPWARTVGPTIFPMFTCFCGMEHRVPYLQGMNEGLPTKER